LIALLSRKIIFKTNSHVFLNAAILL